MFNDLSMLAVVLAAPLIFGVFIIFRENQQKKRKDDYEELKEMDALKKEVRSRMIRVFHDAILAGDDAMVYSMLDVKHVDVNERLPFYNAIDLAVLCGRLDYLRRFALEGGLGLEWLPDSAEVNAVQGAFTEARARLRAQRDKAGAADYREELLLLHTAGFQATNG